MEYRIIHNQKTGFLTGFYSNGGFEIGEVFAFSTLSWLTFETEKEAQNFILRILKECKEQEKRWGDWTDEALRFANKLTYKKYDY